MKIRSITLVALLAAGCSVHLNRASDLQRMHDPEVTMALRVTNLATVREANVARDKASDKNVRDFAIALADERSTLLSHTDNELAKKEIPAADSDLSREIDTESGKSVDALRTRTGRDFDVAYLDRTISFQKYVIDLIDKTLKPIAKAAAVKKALDETRAAAVKDLAKAEGLRNGLR